MAALASDPSWGLSLPGSAATLHAALVVLCRSLGTTGVGMCWEEGQSSVRLQVKLIKDDIAEVPDGVHGPRKPSRVSFRLCPCASQHGRFCSASHSHHSLTSSVPCAHMQPPLAGLSSAQPEPELRAHRHASGPGLRCLPVQSHQRLACPLLHCIRAACQRWPATLICTSTACTSMAAWRLISPSLACSLWRWALPWPLGHRPTSTSTGWAAQMPGP